MTRFQRWKAMAMNLSPDDREMLAKACCQVGYEDSNQTKPYAMNRAIVEIGKAFASKTGD